MPRRPDLSAVTAAVQEAGQGRQGEKPAATGTRRRREKHGPAHGSTSCSRSTGARRSQRSADQASEIVGALRRAQPALALGRWVIAHRPLASSTHRLQSAKRASGVGKPRKAMSPYSRRTQSYSSL